MSDNINISTTSENITGVTSDANHEAEFNQVVTGQSQAQDNLSQNLASNRVASTDDPNSSVSANDIALGIGNLVLNGVAPSGVLGGQIWNTENQLILYALIMPTDDVINADPAFLSNSTHFLLVKEKNTEITTIFTYNYGADNPEVGTPLFPAAPLSNFLPSKISEYLPDVLNKATIFGNIRGGTQGDDTVASLNGGAFWKFDGDSKDNTLKMSALSMFTNALIDATLGEGASDVIEALDDITDVSTAAILLGGAGTLAYKAFLTAGKEGVKEYFKNKASNLLGSGTTIAGIAYRESMLINNQGEISGNNPLHTDELEALIEDISSYAGTLTDIVGAQPENQSIGSRILSWFISDAGRGSDIVPLLPNMPDNNDHYIIKPNGDIYIKNSDGTEEKVGELPPTMQQVDTATIISTQTIETENGGFFYVHKMSDGTVRTSEHIYENGRIVKIIDTRVDATSGAEKTTYEFIYDSDGNVVEARKTFNSDNSLTFEFSQDNGSGAVDFYTPEQVKALEDEMIVVDVQAPDELGLVVITDDGEIGFHGNGNEIRFDNRDGTKVQMWSNEEGTHVAISYDNNTLYVISSDGRRTFYKDGVAVQLPALENSKLIEQFQQFADRVRNGDIGAELPSFAQAFPETDESLKYKLYGTNAENVEIQTVMTSNGLAKLVSQDGEARYVVYADGTISDLSKMVGEDGKLASGNASPDELEMLSQLIDVNEVLFEAWSFSQSMETSLQTWESQYKPIADKLEKELKVILKKFPDHPMSEQINAYIIAYNTGDGAFRFLANITGVLTGDNNTVLDNANIDGAVSGLLDILNADGQLLSGEAEGLKRNLATALYSFQMVKNAHAAFLPDNSTAKTMGNIFDSLNALNSLAALGVVSKDFAAYATLTFGGADTFLKIRESLDAAQQNPDDKGVYDEAIKSVVGLVANLGNLGIVDKEVVDATRGTYAIYDIYNTGSAIYDNWGTDKNTFEFQLDSAGSIISALKVLGDVGWISEADAENIQTISEVLDVANAGYKLANGANIANLSNFALTVANVFADDLNYDQQAAIAVLNIVASVATMNPVGVFVGFLNLIGIFGASSAERAAKREAKRDQYSKVLDNVDANGDGIFLDDVWYEWRNTDDFYYMVGDAALSATKTNYELKETRKTIYAEVRYEDTNPFDYENGGKTILTGRYYYEVEVFDYEYLGLYKEKVFVDIDTVGNIDRAALAQNGYATGSFYELKVTRTFDNSAMGAYVSGSVKVVEGYRDDMSSRELRNLIKNSQGGSYTSTVSISQQEFESGLGMGLVPKAGVYSKQILELLKEKAPMQDDVMVVYHQPDKNLGITQYIHTNDDNGDGKIGEGDILDRVTTFVPIKGEVEGDNSRLVQLLNEGGETYMVYVIPAGRGEGEEPLTNEEMAALAPNTIAGRVLNSPGQVNIADLGLLAENEVSFDDGNLFSTRDALVATAVNGKAWFKSSSGRFVSVFDGKNLVVLDANGNEMARVNNAFDGALPSSHILELLNMVNMGGFEQQMALEMLHPTLVVLDVLNTAKNVEKENPYRSASTLGIDLEKLQVGVMDFGDYKLYGGKDYTIAPLSKAEELAYTSYLAGEMASNPMAYEKMGLSKADLSNPETIAHAARLYVANNTPVGEFFANNERPENIIFDGRSYIIANPQIISEIDGSDLAFEEGDNLEGLVGRMKNGTLLATDKNNLLALMNNVALHYINKGNEQGLIFAQYEVNLDGDRRLTETGEVVSVNNDIIQIGSNGQVSATLTTAVGDGSVVTNYNFDNEGDFTGISRDIDGDGINDIFSAPEKDGGLWQVELSSSGEISSALTASAAEALAGNASLARGSDGMVSDVNGDGVDDWIRVLEDGTGEVTLGVLNNDTNSVELSDMVFTGDSLQGALAKANELKLLAWIAGSDDMTIALGTNVQAAQVSFARSPNETKAYFSSNGFFPDSMNLGKFASENAELLARHDGDMVLALQEYIETKRESLVIKGIGDLDDSIEVISEKITDIENSSDFEKAQHGLSVYEKDGKVFMEAGPFTRIDGEIYYVAWRVSGSEAYSDRLNAAISNYNAELRNLQYRRSEEGTLVPWNLDSDKVAAELRIKEFNDSGVVNNLRAAFNNELRTLENERKILEATKNEYTDFITASSMSGNVNRDRIEDNLSRDRANLEEINNLYDYNMLRTQGAINSDWVFAQKVEVKDYYSDELKAEIESFNAEHQRVSGEIEALIWDGAEMRAAVQPFRITVDTGWGDEKFLRITFSEESEGVVWSGENAEQAENLIEQFNEKSSKNLLAAYQQELDMLKNNIASLSKQLQGFISNPVLASQTLDFTYDINMRIAENIIARTDGIAEPLRDAAALRGDSTEIVHSVSQEAGSSVRTLFAPPQGNEIMTVLDAQEAEIIMAALASQSPEDPNANNRYNS